VTVADVKTYLFHSLIPYLIHSLTPFSFIIILMQ